MGGGVCVSGGREGRESSLSLSPSLSLHDYSGVVASSG